MLYNDLITLKKNNESQKDHSTTETIKYSKTLKPKTIEPTTLETTKINNYTYGRTQWISISYRELTPEIK